MVRIVAGMLPAASRPVMRQSTVRFIPWTAVPVTLVRPA